MFFLIVTCIQGLFVSLINNQLSVLFILLFIVTVLSVAQ